MCYLMKKFCYVLLVILMAAIPLCVHAEDDSDTVPKSRMIFEVSGLYNDSSGKPFCVNDTLAIYVKNHNTRKTLGSAFVRVYYGLEMVAALYTQYTGVVYFTPNRTGIHKVFIQKLKYQDIRGTFNVTDCTKPTTTSTSTTTSSTTPFVVDATTIPEPETTTTIKRRVSTTTLIEEGVPVTVEPTFPECSACKAKSDQKNILYAVAIALTLVVLTYSLLSDKKKKGNKSTENALPAGGPDGREEGPAHHKKHKSLHHRLGLKKEKGSNGEDKK